eukprot:591849_1
METFMRLTCSCVYILIMLTLFCPSHVPAAYDYNNWIAPSSPTLPRAVSSAAVAYDLNNERIWILGSWQLNERQLISYGINSNVFTDYNATALSNPVYGHGDFYTQIDDILYMIDPIGDKLSTFDVNTAQFTYYYQNIDIPYAVYGSGGCLASIDDALFVLGRHSYLQYVQVLNLTTQVWIATRSLSEGRARGSCVVHPYNNVLYAIGGWGGGSGTQKQTIEKLYVGDLAHLSQYDWEFINSLPHPRA